MRRTVTIRRRLPRWLLDALDARAQHYRATFTHGYRVIWLGFGEDHDNATWVPVAYERVIVVE